MKRKRPFLLWLVCFVYLAAAFVELLKAITAVTSWNILLAIRYQPSPLYPLFFGALFFLLFLASAILLWMRLPWSTGFTAAASILFALWYWMDKFVIAVNPQPFSAEAFNFIAFFFVLALLLASMWALEPSMKYPRLPVRSDDPENGDPNE